MSSKKKGARGLQPSAKAPELKKSQIEEIIINPDINSSKPTSSSQQVKSSNSLSPIKTAKPIIKETEDISISFSESLVSNSPNRSESLTNKLESLTKPPSPIKSFSKFSKKSESPFTKNDKLRKELNSIQEVSLSPNINYKSLSKDLTFYKQKKKKEKEVITNQEVESKIKSRRRVLEILEDQVGSISQDTLLQIESRDNLIDELTKELLSLRSLVKETKTVKDAEENIKAKLLQQRTNELEHEKILQENRIKELEEMNSANHQNFEEEKTQFELLQESLCEEIELLKVQLKNKEDENTSMLDDIKKLSEIIQQFKALNNELNKKIDKQNEDLESCKIKYYESEVKVTNIGDLERSIEEYVTLYKKSDNRANKRTEELKKTRVVLDEFRAFCKYAEEKLAEELMNIDSILPLYQNLNHLKNEIKKRRDFNVNIEIAEIEELKKDDKIRILNEKLEKSFRDYKILENSQKPLLEQINGMKELIEYIKGEYNDSINHLNQTMKTIQDLNESYKTEIQSLRLELSKKEVKITTLNSKLVVLEAKESKFEEKIKKIIDSRTTIEKELTDCKTKYNIINTQLKEKQSEITTLQKQNNKYTINIQSLHEEF